MQQGFEPAALLRVGENQLAQGRAVELAITLQHARAEVFDDAGQRRAAGLDHPAGGLVGIHQVHTQLDEALGGRTLAAADATGQAEYPGSESGLCHLKPVNCQ
ncbi:hypothetical protein D3C75_1188200 [compost metagenome]